MKSVCFDIRMVDVSNMIEITNITITRVFRKMPRLLTVWKLELSICPGVNDERKRAG
jgi:hypothetical protein